MHYDFTVRDSSGSIVQFNYGEDGLDPVQSSLLGGKDNQLLFLDKNSMAFVHKYSLNKDFFSKKAEGGLQLAPAEEHHKRMQSAIDLINRKNAIKSGTSIFMTINCQVTKFVLMKRSSRGLDFSD